MSSTSKKNIYEKMREKQAESFFERPAPSGVYVVYQCKNCRGTPKILRDELVPKELVCVKCGGHVLAKIMEQKGSR